MNPNDTMPYQNWPQAATMPISWPQLAQQQVHSFGSSTFVQPGRRQPGRRQPERRQNTFSTPPPNAQFLSATHVFQPTHVYQPVYGAQYPEPIWVNTMDQQQFPRLLPPVAIPRQFTDAPKRTPSSTTLTSSGSSSTVTAIPTPIPNPNASQMPSSQTLHVPLLLPEITTPAELKKAVEASPQSVLNQVTSLLTENATLKADLQSVSEDYRHARMDYQQKREQYDTLIAIEKAKQVVLWKHIGRLQGGLFDPDAEKMGGSGVVNENLKGVSGLEGFGLKGAGERYAVREKEKQRQLERDLKMSAEGRFNVGGEGSPTRRTSSVRRGSPMRATGSPMTVVSEVSEDSEKSDDLASALSASSILDPTAHTFIPSFGSPSKNVKYHEERSNAFMLNPSFIPGIPNMPLGPDSLTEVELQTIIASLPRRFYGICPISFSTNNPCDVLSCRLDKTCNQFNDETNGGGECGQPEGDCPFRHEIRTCAEEIQGFACDYKKIKEVSLKKKGHMTKRAHKDGCGKEEWKVREAVAKLVWAHREGRY